MYKKTWVYYVIILLLILALTVALVKIAAAPVQAWNEPTVIDVYYDPQHSDDPVWDGKPIWTNKMIALHDAAEVLRQAGYSDDSKIISELSKEWNNEYRDLCITAKVIEGEAKESCYQHMVYVGAVLVNRKNSTVFQENTIPELVAAPGQYSSLYLTGFDTIPLRCFMAAKDALDGNHDAPNDLYWQAEYIQGREIWKIFNFRSDYYNSTTFFCRGTIFD